MPIFAGQPAESQLDVSGRVGQTMNMADRDWARLARYVRERREDLGLTQEDVASQGGPSTATIRLIETGAQTAYRQKSLRQLEDGLRWAPGSVRAILTGGEPGTTVPVPQPEEDSRPRYADPLLDDVAGLLASKRAHEGPGGRLSEDEIRGIVHLVDLLRRRGADPEQVRKRA